MPNIIDKNMGSTYLATGEDLGYRYPNGRDLKPGSKLHQEILTRIINRARESHAETSKRFPVWKKIDRSLTAFVPTDDAERAVKDKDSRKPVSIVVPYSYATLETLLTYMTAAFLDNPIFKYEGVGPEDRVGAMMMEKVIEIQCARSKAALNLHTAFRDGYSYGLGVVAPMWATKWGKKTVIEPDGIMSAIFQKFIPLGNKRVNKDAILYEGNVFKNIDPYLYLPDPNVPADSPQRGEFVGWIEPTNYMKLLQLEKDSGGTFFNVKYLKEIRSGSGKSQYNTENSDSGRNERLNTGDPIALETRPIDALWMYVEIIPKEWKLSDVDYPEKWLFGVGADKIVIAASPMNLNHNMFPVGVCVPDSDGYSVSPISRLEMVYGLQETLDWLFSSHMANVRKAINDMLIVDPSLININDLKDPAPGQLLRMRRAAWGRGVENAVKQLPVTDITAQHIRDSGYVTDLMQKCTGSVDAISGFRRQTSERVSAAEATGDRSGALSRLAKAARLVSLQMMQDLGYMVASHTQQLMEQELYVSMTGRWQEDLIKEYGIQPGSKMSVTPFDLAIDYDVFQKDGSVAGGEDGNTWVQLYQIIAQNPELTPQFEMTRIFLHIARQLGAKDIQDFIRTQPQLRPDEVVAREVQAGNLIPASEVPQVDPQEQDLKAAQAENMRAKAMSEKAKAIQMLTQGPPTGGM